MIALIRELWNDRNGDVEKDSDMYWRIFWVLVETGIHYFIFNKSFLPSLAFPCAIFVCLFDYLIAYILIKRKKIEDPDAHWFHTVSKRKVIDKETTKLHPWARFIIRFILLGTTITFYIFD